MKLNKILVPLDGSALAESAIVKAMDLAGGCIDVHAPARRRGAYAPRG